MLDLLSSACTCSVKGGMIPPRPDKEVLDEEKRLAYVGVTRAKERLFITRAEVG